MLRTFIIILEIVLLVMVLRSSFVQYFLSDVQTSLSDWMTELSLVAETQELDALKESIYPHLMDVREYQKDYLNEILSEKSKLMSFHKKYCIAGDKNPYVFGANLNLICTAINRTKLIGDGPKS